MEICRICMQEDDGKLVSIFSKLDSDLIADIITSCCSVQLTQNDGLPDLICYTCVQDVKLIAAFIAKVQESDCKLRQLSTSNSEIKSAFEMVVVKAESTDENQSSDDEFASDIVECKLDSTHDDDQQAHESLNIYKTRKLKVVRKAKAELSDASEDESKILPEEKELQMFTVVNLPPNSFICCSCYQSFDSEKTLESHVNIHKKFAVKNRDCIYCTVCKRKFKKSTALKRHLKNVSEITQLYECIKCNMRFMNRTGTRLHSQKHTEEKTLPKETLCCVQNCSKSFDSEELLIQHGHDAHRLNKRAYELGDTASKPVECPVCFKRFPSEKLLRRHRKRNSRPLNHQCASCGLKFRTKDVLALHELNHENQKPFQCSDCNKYFSSKNSLKVHQRCHSNERPFVCIVCDAGFFQKAQLTIHEHIHTDAPLPFQCEVCDKSFKMKNYLVNHMRQHTGEKPYPCRHCPRSFSNHTNRQRHEMNHTGNKPFKCSYCDKTFTIKRLQLEHECKHTGIKPYKCSYCDKTFIRKSFQLDHEATHTGIKPHRCAQCNRTFTQKTALRRHLQSHQAEPENHILTAASSTTSTEPIPQITGIAVLSTPVASS
ncbi:gastrula zinc finger protein XlCGF26.1-like [Sabethes cyaneus]|uniref:gastrula zinc finger protein XlCGF26.1-like n=1 Tax=Sabethes cyaneus TaxID=53552 RepID=UPI00237D406C|nr:gastrula zinc finger protein XlCGF26.1-like [Sabethes cyaneus]